MVNEWIRTSREYDGGIDFDKLLRDPKAPSAGGRSMTAETMGTERMLGIKLWEMPSIWRYLATEIITEDG